MRPDCSTPRRRVPAVRPDAKWSPVGRIGRTGLFCEGLDAGGDYSRRIFTGMPRSLSCAAGPGRAFQCLQIPGDQPLLDVAGGRRGFGFRGWCGRGLALLQRARSFARPRPARRGSFTARRDVRFRLRLIPETRQRALKIGEKVIQELGSIREAVGHQADLDGLGRRGVHGRLALGSEPDAAIASAWSGAKPAPPAA